MDSEEKPLFHDIENLYILYAVCHIASMTSAISNPILYGFLNENFRKEFSNIWTSLKRCSKCKSASSNGIATSEEIPINLINHLTKPVNVWKWKDNLLFFILLVFWSLLPIDRISWFWFHSTNLTPPRPQGVFIEAKLSTEFKFGSLVR